MARRQPDDSGTGYSFLQVSVRGTSTARLARSFQQWAQLVVNFRRRKRFSYVPRGSLADRVDHSLSACFRANDEHRQVIPLLTALEGGEQLKSIHFGHVDVAENGVDGAPREKLQRLLPIACLTHF